MGHSHSHHGHKHSSGSNLKLAFFLNLGFTILEIFGGLYTNSVAILSDAVHDLGDSFSLGLAWYLNKKSKKTATNQFSFGYQRFSLAGAFINALILLVGSIYIITEAIQRFQNPEVSDAQGMILFALVGVSVNGYAAYRVSKGASQNEKVISWHLVEDVLGWVAVLIAGIVLYFKDIPWLDPALSLGIALFILWNVFKNLKGTIYIFLQAVPDNVSLDEIKGKICQLEKVDSVHHMHVWSLEGEHHVFSVHAKLAPAVSIDELVDIKTRIKTILKSYPFSHYTVEIELDGEECLMENSNHDH
jgi:cobalt-zinc-cadmium efflux system protein